MLYLLDFGNRNLRLGSLLCEEVGGEDICLGAGESHGVGSGFDFLFGFRTAVGVKDPNMI